MRAFAIGILVLTTSAPLMSCIWDRDTFAMEARGRLEVVETAVGWFDRFPPEYYQMRLERVTREVTAHPDRLDLYDDAAVACDRLGKHAEAVGWMEKKGTAMQALPAAQAKDHRYRMLANLGVFHTHLWLKSADRGRLPGMLDQAIQDVAAALEINPNAHFGRESVHLALLKWWKKGTEGEGTAEWGPLAGELFEKQAGDHTRAVLIKGLCGLIQMGSAQESLDVHAILARQLVPSLQHEKAHHYSLYYLTCLRLGELLLDEKPAVHPHLMKSIRLEEPVERGIAPPSRRTNVVDLLGQDLARDVTRTEGSRHDASIIARYFHEARAAAVRRHAEKTAYMLSQFKEGRHPDTHADFWKGWQEPLLPRLPPQTDVEKHGGLRLGGWLMRHPMGAVGGTFLVGTLLALFVILAVVRRRAAGGR